MPETDSLGTRRYYIALFNPFCFIDSNPEDASHFCGVIFFNDLII